MPTLNIPYLHGYWQRALGLPYASPAEEDLDATLLSGLGLNVLETNRQLHAERPTFEQFEAWIAATAGDEMDLDRLRRALNGEAIGSGIEGLDQAEGLTLEDLAHWDEHGYVIVRNAVPLSGAQAAEAAIFNYLGMDAANPETWYSNNQGHSIWVSLLRHPTFRANRRSPRLVKAFAQLWGRDDLWCTVDQGGLNPPERPGWPFPGPHIHWDTTIAPPHLFGLQGILYLADTAENQGAFSCVPGFHRTLPDWLSTVPAEADARQYARATLTMKPIAANAGDLILWHHLLPHGSSPNTALRPRVVQYISMRPTRWPHHDVWR